MYLNQWQTEMVEQTAVSYSDKVKQFALTPLTLYQGEYHNVAQLLMRLGIWAFQKPDQVLSQIAYSRPYTVMIGFKPSRFHLGHITLAREVAWHQINGGIPIFVVSGHEAGVPLSDQDAVNKVKQFWRIVTDVLGFDLPHPLHIYSDSYSKEISELERQVGDALTVQKVLNLYGWEPTSTINRLRIASTICAAFLLPQVLFPNLPSLVPIDINQVTHSELARFVSGKLNLSMPTFTYRMLLPSLLGPTVRMSIKDPRSALFLDEDRVTAESKLRKCFSGGRATAKEQSSIGGDVYVCSFFRIAETTLEISQTSSMLSECVSGTTLCRECKAGHINAILQKLNAND